MATYNLKMDKINAALVVLRASVGLSMAYHGLNKARSFAGTTSWFASIGMKWPKKQAAVAVLTEIVGGIGLACGAATPLTLTAVIALMVVAIVTVHRSVVVGSIAHPSSPCARRCRSLDPVHGL
jgi:putative oxidoreductase